jgi:hypothetical protein
VSVAFDRAQCGAQGCDDAGLRHGNKTTRWIVSSYFVLMRDVESIV